MVNVVDASNVDNEEMIAATLEQSSTISPDDIQLNSELVSTTPKDTIADTQSEQTIADALVSSTKEVIFFTKLMTL